MIKLRALSRNVHDDNRLYLFDLAHCVEDETTSFGAVMERETRAGFVFTEKGRSSHPRIRELKNKSLVTAIIPSNNRCDISNITFKYSCKLSSPVKYKQTYKICNKAV